MIGFAYFQDSGVGFNVSDISAVEFDEDNNGEQYVVVYLRVPNLSFRVYVDHDDFIAALQEFHNAAPNAGGLLDC